MEHEKSPLELAIRTMEQALRNEIQLIGIGSAQDLAIASRRKEKALRVLQAEEKALFGRALNETEKEALLSMLAIADESALTLEAARDVHSAFQEKLRMQVTQHTNPGTYGASSYHKTPVAHAPATLMDSKF